MQWSVGITTVPQRRSTLLPRTLASLRAAGFGHVSVFFDGLIHRKGLEDAAFIGNLGSVAIRQSISALANWMLGLHELWLRNPQADRFLMVQDDVVFVRNLREYLEDTCRDPFHNRASFVPQNRLYDQAVADFLGYLHYWNLYCASTNDEYINRAAGFPVFQAKEGSMKGFWDSDQKGRGALALVFNNPGVQMLLRSPAWAEAALSGTDRATKRIDGTISSAFRAARGRELVHWPSLCQHVGEESTLGNLPGATHKAPSFPGENFDATEWLK